LGSNEAANVRRIAVGRGLSSAGKFSICWWEDVVSAPADALLRAVALLKGRNFWHDAAGTGIAFGYACVIGIAGAARPALSLNRLPAMWPFDPRHRVLMPKITLIRSSCCSLA
jgi:hypothetical protein